VAVCRKTFIDKVINEFAEHQIGVVRISLGHGLCSSVTPYFSNGVLQSSNACLNIEEKEISKIEQIDNPVAQQFEINGIEISSDDLLSFCGALLVIRDNYHPATNLNHLNQQLYASYRQRRLFKQGSKMALYTILGVLLINFAFYSHYFNEVKSLKETVLVNETTMQKLTVLNTQVDKLQKKVEDMFKSGASKSSWYIDQLVRNLPESLTLSDLKYHPLAKKIRPGQPIQLNNDQIIIAGESSDRDAFSQWVALLETKEWIEKVEIAKYQDVTNQHSEFQLKLSMNDEH